jgi:hypothetical protein
MQSAKRLKKTPFNEHWIELNGKYLVSLVDLSKLAFQCCNSLIGLCLGAKKFVFGQLFKSIVFKSCLGVLWFTCCACTFQGAFSKIWNFLTHVT